MHTQIPALTFAQFQATGRGSADIREVDPDMFEQPQPGRVYLDCLWIAREPDGRWSCVCMNADVLDADLAVVERFLFEGMEGEAHTIAPDPIAAETTMNTKFFLLCTDGATFAFPTAELLAEARTQFLRAVTFEHGRAVLPGEAWTVEAVGTRAPMFSAPADVYDHVANLAVFG